MDNTDKELLISEVQKFPCLYNHSDENYRDKVFKKKAWTTVSKKIGCSGMLDVVIIHFHFERPGCYRRLIYFHILKCVKM